MIKIILNAGKSPEIKIFKIIWKDWNWSGLFLGSDNPRKLSCSWFLPLSLAVQLFYYVFRSTAPSNGRLSNRSQYTTPSSSQAVTQISSTPHQTERCNRMYTPLLTFSIAPIIKGTFHCGTHANPHDLNFSALKIVEGVKRIYSEPRSERHFCVFRLHYSGTRFYSQTCLRRSLLTLLLSAWITVMLHLRFPAMSAVRIRITKFPLNHNFLCQSLFHLFLPWIFTFLGCQNVIRMWLNFLTFNWGSKRNETEMELKWLSSGINGF